MSISRQSACKPGSVRGRPARRPFIWDARCRTPRATNPDGGPKTGLERKRSEPSLFGFAPGGVCRAAPVARNAVRSYRTLSPLPSEALAKEGGLLSVALSLGSPPPGVTRHRVSVEPGLSSPPANTRQRTGRPPGQLTYFNMKTNVARSRGGVAHRLYDFFAFVPVCFISAWTFWQ